MKKRTLMITWLLILSVLCSSFSAFATGSDAETEEQSSEAEQKETEEAETEKHGAHDKAGILEELGTVAQEGAIADGIYIGNTDVSGMTPEEAIDAVLAEVDKLAVQKVTVKVDDERVLETNLQGLGFYSDNVAECVGEAVAVGKDGMLIERYKGLKDLAESTKVLDLTYNIEKDVAAATIEGQAGQFIVAPVDASITKNGNDFVVTESTDGSQINQKETVERILEAFENWDGNELTANASLEVVKAGRTADQLARIKDKLGGFSTKMTQSTSRGKGWNVVLGAEKINGTVIMPGETWSAYETFAPFNAENGWKEDIAYLNGGYNTEFGGGVCQLATTLYNAALLAEINISQRSNHSMTVGYTQVSFDATINDSGSKDLKLTNDFDFPVYIEGYYSDGRVYFNIYGEETRPANRTLNFYNKILSEEYPTEVEYIDDPTLPLGVIGEVVQQSAYPACKAQAYKQVFVDGVLKEETLLHTDTYVPSAKKVKRGSNAELLPKPSETTPEPSDTNPSSETNPAGSTDNTQAEQQPSPSDAQTDPAVSQ